MPEINEGAAPTPEGGEGEGKSQGEKFEVSKSEYDELVKDRAALGSLKREFKDFKKSVDEKTKETPEKTKTEDTTLMQKLERMALRQAGLTHQDDIELARATAKKWGMDVEDVVADDDFKVKLERQQTTRANAEAASNVKGGTGGSSAKSTPEYWIAKGTPPSRTDVPDRKTRAAIIRKMMGSATNGKKFYND